MKKTTFLKKAKKLGLTVDEPNDGRRCYIHHNGQIASWFWQDSYSHPGELEGTNWHIKDNKRSTRYNRVGRMGLMIDAGDKQAKVQWLQASASELRLQECYPNTYGTGGFFTEWVQDNDLEVVAAA